MCVIFTMESRHPRLQVNRNVVTIKIIIPQYLNIQKVLFYKNVILIPYFQDPQSTTILDFSPKYILWISCFWSCLITLKSYITRFITETIKLHLTWIHKHSLHLFIRSPHNTFQDGILSNLFIIHPQVFWTYPQTIIICVRLQVQCIFKKEVCIVFQIITLHSTGLVTHQIG